MFGVLKRRFRILLLGPEYDIEFQRRIPAALAALHNFIVVHEPKDLPEDGPNFAEPIQRRGDPNDLDHRASSEDAVGVPTDQEIDDRRDRIAQAMWDEYVVLRRQMGMPVDGDDEAEDDEEDEEDADDDRDEDQTVERVLEM